MNQLARTMELCRARHTSLVQMVTEYLSGSHRCVLVLLTAYGSHNLEL